MHKSYEELKAERKRKAQEKFQKSFEALNHPEQMEVRKLFTALVEKFEEKFVNTKSGKRIQVSSEDIEYDKDKMSYKNTTWWPLLETLLEDYFQVYSINAEVNTVGGHDDPEIVITYW